MSCLPEREIAARLDVEISSDMANGDIPWECRTVAEIAATGVDPIDAVSREIDERTRETGQDREQVTATVIEIEDRILASRVTFGRPDKPSFYVGTPPQQHITAQSPFVEGDAPDLSTNELEFRITEGQDSRFIFLSTADVDDLIVGLLRWRAAHPDPTPPSTTGR